MEKTTNPNIIRNVVMSLDQYLSASTKSTEHITLKEIDHIIDMLETYSDDSGIKEHIASELNSMKEKAKQYHSTQIINMVKTKTNFENQLKLAETEKAQLKKQNFIKFLIAKGDYDKKIETLITTINQYVTRINEVSVKRPEICANDVLIAQMNIKKLAS